jgi:hypothetical protein
VIALQKFMSSFLRSQRGPVGGIDVELEGVYRQLRCCPLLPHRYAGTHFTHSENTEKGTDIPTAGSRATTHVDLSPKDVADTALEAEPAPDSSALEENTSQERLALVKGTYEYLIGLCYSLSAP